MMNYFFNELLFDELLFDELLFQRARYRTTAIGACL